MTALTALTAISLGSPEPHTPEWYAIRDGGIGGSEIAAIVGLSPWESPYSLWWKKKTRAQGEPNDEMLWGTYLEPSLIAWYFGVLRPAATRLDAATMFAHRSRRWQRANLDALAVDEHGPVIVECKKASDDAQWVHTDPGEDDVIPIQYRCQVMQYMDVLGVGRAHLVVSDLGRAPQLFQVAYHPEEARYLRGMAAAFHRSLYLDQRPDLDAHGATYRTVREQHPSIERVAVQVPAELADRYAFTQAAEKYATEQAREAKTRLLDAMGPARVALAGDVEVARRQPGRGGAISLYNLAKKGPPQCVLPAVTPAQT